MQDLRREAITEAMQEAELDRDFLRQLATLYVDGLTPDEIKDYLAISDPETDR